MTDDDATELMVETCTRLYMNSVAMESILDKLAPEEWRHMRDTIVGCDEATQIREAFHQTLAAAVRGSDRAAVLAALQSMTPRTK